MDFSVAVKWGIRIVTAAAIFSLILVILTSITIPLTPLAGVFDGLSTVLGIFYYFVPTASVLFPLMLAMWVSLSLFLLLVGLLLVFVHFGGLVHENLLENV